jgi:hypothetical protein
MPKHATRRERQATSKTPNRDEEPKGRDKLCMQTIPPTELKDQDYYLENGFTSCEELISFALNRKELWELFGTNHAPRWKVRVRLTNLAKQLWVREVSYPSEAELESQYARVRELAREVFASFSSNEIVEWTVKQLNRADLTEGFHALIECTRAQVKHTKHLLPVPAIYDKEYADACFPNVIFPERHGMYKLPNGEVVVRRIALEYMREAWNQILSARFRCCWHDAVRAVIKRNRDDAAANAANAAATDERRRVRAQADAAAAAKQPRAYTAAGSSHKEGAAKWADEPPTAAEAAKREVAKAASLEAKAAAIAAKKEAEAQATAERLEQLRCLHVAEEIGGSH